MLPSEMPFNQFSCFPLKSNEGSPHTALGLRHSVYGNFNNKKVSHITTHKASKKENFNSVVRGDTPLIKVAEGQG